jgi:hypothetical protein
MRFKSDDQRKAVFAKKKFYHGSAGFRGRVVGAEGLVPPTQQFNAHVGDEMRGPEFDEFVFLTTDKDLAKLHAERRARHWGDNEYGPIVYEVELEEEEVVPDTFDPVMYPESFKYKGIIPPEKLKKVKKFSNKKISIAGQKDIKCVKCGKHIDAIDVFPGNRCMECYEKDFDSDESEDKKVQDFKSAWGGGVIR